MEGPPKAQVDPAPLGPKERKLKREELALYQFIASGQKVSPLAGSRCWCHDSLDATESISGRLAQSRHDTFTFYRHSNLQRKLPTLWGEEALGWQTRHPKHPTSTKQKQKNEATAGIALIEAAVADFKMYAGHQLLGEEDVEDLTPSSAPVPDRQTPSSPDTS